MESPWLTPKEAADYCKISLSLFNQIRRSVPIQSGGTQRRPRFHRDELDYWMRMMFMNKIVASTDWRNRDERCQENRILGQYPIRIKEGKYKAHPVL